MATQSLAPDALLIQTNLTGALSLVQDDPDLAIGTDTSWMEATSDSSNTELRVSFPTPGGRLTPGATQTLKAKVRKSAALGNSGTARLELWESGVQKVVGSETAISNDTGQILSLTFTDANITDKTGVGVECDVFGTTAGGKATDRRVNDIGAVEWDVVYDEAAATTVKTGTDTPTIGATEVKNLAARSAINDTPTVGITDTASVQIKAAMTVTDVTTLSITDDVIAEVTLPIADSIAIGLSEVASFPSGIVAKAGAETLSITIEEKPELSIEALLLLKKRRGN